MYRLLKSIGRHGYNLARWWGSEFLPMSGGSTLSSRLTDLCRLLGVGTIVAIMAFETDSFVVEGLRTGWPVWALDGIVAILIGNVVKEVAIWLSARIVNALGADLYRQGVMLNGHAFAEVFRSDGTWRRHEFGDRETICEWTDRFGACSRRVTGPRVQLRSRYRS